MVEGLLNHAIARTKQCVEIKMHTQERGLTHADRLPLNIHGWLPCASGISSSLFQRPTH